MHPSLNPTPSTAKLRVLDDDQARAIHNASLDVLEHTGYHIPIERSGSYSSMLVQQGRESVSTSLENWLIKISKDSSPGSAL